MCNCNQKRQAISSENRSRMGKMKMRYVGNGSFSINGNVTGRLYAFAAEGAIVMVDPRDAMDFEEVPELQLIS